MGESTIEDRVFCQDVLHGPLELLIGLCKQILDRGGIATIRVDIRLTSGHSTPHPDWDR